MLSRASESTSKENGSDLFAPKKDVSALFAPREDVSELFAPKATGSGCFGAAAVLLAGTVSLAEDKGGEGRGWAAESEGEVVVSSIHSMALRGTR